MLKPNDVPEWAWEEATEAILRPKVSSGAMFSEAYIVPVARALANAERKGRESERARCEQAATDGTLDEHELAQATEFGRGADSAARDILKAIQAGE